MILANCSLCTADVDLQPAPALPGPNSFPFHSPTICHLQTCKQGAMRYIQQECCLVYHLSTKTRLSVRLSPTTKANAAKAAMIFTMVDSEEMQAIMTAVSKKAP